MNPLTVFHLIYSLESGGAEVDLLAKSRVLVQTHGYDVTIGCLLKRGELATQAEAAGIPVLGSHAGEARRKRHPAAGRAHAKGGSVDLSILPYQD